jgi:endonuclease/exonuclease/phosphatase (EEP) superfamily protein YafD
MLVGNYRQAGVGTKQPVDTADLPPLTARLVQRFARLRALLRRAVATGGILLGIASLFGFLSGYSALADQFCHWRVQYAVTLGLLALLFALRRRGRWTALFAAFAVVNAATLLPYLPKSAPPVSPDAPRLRVVHANVLWINDQHEKVKRLIAEEKPDIIALAELTDRWLSWLEPLRAEYPYHAKASYQGGKCALGFWSRYPIRRVETEPFRGRGMLVAELNAPDGPLTVIVAHTDSPGRVSAVPPRDRHLKAIGERVRAIGRRVLVVGDLNTTPFSHGYREMVRLSSLREGSRDLGLLPSWPRQVPPLLLPIDHVLVTPDLTLLAWHRGRPIRSDHYPVVAEIALGSAAAPGTTVSAWDEKPPNRIPASSNSTKP